MPWLAFGTTSRELRDGDLIVGSGAEADWRVATADLTARHFVVGWRDGKISVRAHSPDNMVVVNGRQLGLEPVQVGDGDTIFAGSGRFSCSSDAPRTAMVPEMSAEPAYFVDDSSGIAHPLSGRSTPIGRDASNAVVVRDPTASRFHAEVRREAGGFAVHSMGATGTSLNGKPLRRPSMLSEGDVVEIAFARLRFTRQAPSGDISLAEPHSTRNDESARKPTLESSQRVVVDEANDAGRDTRRVQVLVALGVILVAAIGWALFAR